MPDGTPAPLAARNVLILNPQPGALAFASAAIARSARVVQLQEFGHRYVTAKCHSPSASYMQTMLPPGVTFGQSDNALAPLLSNLLAPRLLIAHSVGSYSRLERLASLAKFDAACIGVDVDLENTRRALYPMRPVADLESPLLPGVRFLATSAGRLVLETALVLLENQHRRRLRLRQHVYDIGDVVLHTGFYPVERDRHWSWAWTGPDTIATFMLPGLQEGPVLHTLFFFATKFELHPHEVRIMVNGRDSRCAFFNDENKLEIASECGGTLHDRIDIVQREMIATADHSRFIGLALHKIKAEARH